MKSWKTYFIELTLQVASKSKDPSRQVGCVIVGPDKEIRSTGFNGFPRGVKEMAPTDPHHVVDYERRIDYGDYIAKCCCGELVSFSMTHVGIVRLDELTVVHPHFEQESEMILSDRWDRPQKYQYVEHAERNAIYNAARVGTPLLGCSAFVSLAPCVGCARALVQAGITEVYGPAFEEAQNDIYHFDISQRILHEGGVNYVVVEYAKEDTT